MGAKASAVLRVVQIGSSEEPVRNGTVSLDGRPVPARPPQTPGMFVAVLPRPPRPGDVITLDGQIAEGATQFAISLIAGEYSAYPSDVACQIAGNFSNNASSLNIIQDGQVMPQEGPHSSISLDSLLVPGYDFKFKFSFMQGNGLYLDINDSYYSQLLVQHNLDDVAYLQMSGDVAKISALTFNYA